MNLIYVGYGLTVINYIFYCASRFQKDKKNILFLDLFAKTCTIFALYCFGSLTGSYIMFLKLIIGIVCYTKECKNWKLFFLYWVFEIIFILILWNTYIGISSVLVFVCSSISLLANWWLSPQYMRISAVVGSGFYLAYQISISNWAGLLEIVALGSNIGAYVKYKRSSLTEGRALATGMAGGMQK